jgi:hypothetical protein
MLFLVYENLGNVGGYIWGAQPISDRDIYQMDIRNVVVATFDSPLWENEFDKPAGSPLARVQFT